jgi:hypothetical protein
MGEFPCGSCFLLHINGLITTKEKKYIINITFLSEKKCQRWLFSLGIGKALHCPIKRSSSVDILARNYIAPINTPAPEGRT